MPVIGFLGVGHIASDLVEGLVRAGMPPAGLLLSPRGRDMVATLHERHAIPVAADNAALVATSDIVVLAVRPAAVPDALRGLPWHTRQVLLSVAAGASRAALLKIAAPAAVVRAMPISAARLGASPTTLHPDEPRARALLARLGPVLPIADESVFDRATISAALYGWVHALIGDSADWLAAAGLEASQARALAAGTFAAASEMVSASEAPIEGIVDGLMTPGGITEAGCNSLQRYGVSEAWKVAFDTALARLEALAQPRSG